MRLPEEVYRAEAKGTPRAEEELTREERRRRRAKKKRSHKSRSEQQARPATAAPFSSVHTFVPHIRCKLHRYRFGPAYLLDVMDATRPGGQGGLGTMLDQDNCWNHVMWRFFRKTSDGPFDQKGLPQVLRCLGDICR